MPRHSSKFIKPSMKAHTPDLLQSKFFEFVGICKPLKSLDPILDPASKNRTLQQIPRTRPSSKFLRVRGGSRGGTLNGGRLPETSNCFCHPGKAGGLPLCAKNRLSGLDAQALR